MSDIRHIFFDIGGVLATNGWDRTQRKAAIERFNLDPVDFQLRHEEMVGALEEGHVSLDEYLEFTVFFRAARFHARRIQGLHLCPEQAAR